jgi:hypothetical protein
VEASLSRIGGDRSLHFRTLGRRLTPG